MGMDAEIVAIGPFDFFKKLGILDYDEESYEGAQPDDVIIVTVAGADTTDQSRDLAELVCVDPWELWRHRIVKLAPRATALLMCDIGRERPEEILAVLEKLLKMPGVQVWFRPNG